MLFRSVKVIDLLAQSKVAWYLVSQSIPKMMSNSFTDKITKFANRSQFSRLMGQSLHILLNLTDVPIGDTAFNAMVRSWGTKPKSRITLLAINEFDTPVSNNVLTLLLKRVSVPSKFCCASTSKPAASGITTFRYVLAACP